jgi:hypothetical protein
MKYILMMQFKVEGWKTGNIGTWPPKDVQANIDFLRRFHEELTESGELVSHQGLGGPETIQVVRARNDAGPAITDGPFPESKEFLAGYWIVDVDGPERALRLGARLSAIPGRGGGPANIPIEVRPLMRDKGGDVE